MSEDFQKKFTEMDFSAFMRDRKLPSTNGNPLFKVMVDDNFNYQDEGERHTHGCYATLDEAIFACRRIVEDYLASAHKPGMTARELLSSYQSFGDDPYIVSNQGSAGFSAWDYAKRRSEEICR